jgi:uncharacterized membrane protein YfcA
MMPETIVLNSAEITLLVGVICWSSLVGAVLGYRFGNEKRRPVLGMILGGVLVITGLLMVWLLPAREPAYY